MKNKGFTLVELLAVIMIIGILGAVTIPVIDNLLESSRTKAYNEQVKMIEVRAEDWATMHINEIGDDLDSYISLGTLINSGYFDQDELINPLTKEPMTGCVKVSYSDIYDKYIFTYGEYSGC